MPHSRKWMSRTPSSLKELATRLPEPPMQLPKPARPLALARPSRDWGGVAALAPPAATATDAKAIHSRREMPPIPVSNDPQGGDFCIFAHFRYRYHFKRGGSTGDDDRRAQDPFRHTLAHHRPDHA